MSREDFGNIIQIGDILVSEEVVTECFSCDYGKCKGVCCVVGDSGAPLEEYELEAVERNYPVYSPLMKEDGRAAVDRKGFFEVDVEGDMVTPLSERTGACAYMFSDEGGNNLCSMERCFFEGKCSFRKPSSCWLYPIRVTKLTGGGRALNLHRWKLCKDAFRKGREEGVRVYEFLKEPLAAVFGREFWDALDAARRKYFV